MMTGRQHYTKAQALLEGLPDDIPEANSRIAEAQAHATLALTAATLGAGAVSIPRSSKTAVWLGEVLGE